MKVKTVYIIWAVYFGLALVCQLAMPDGFKSDFFAFPVNAALLLAGAVALWILYREMNRSAVSRLLAAPATTFLLLAVSAVTFLILGLTTWLKPDSRWFFFVFLALLAHLLFVIFRGLRRGRPHRLRFLLNHVGLTLALIGGFAGAPDTIQWRLPVSRHEPTQTAFSRERGFTRLRQTFQLEDFNVSYYPNGQPADYEARLKVDERPVVLRVNEPYGLSLTDDLYLVDYEKVPAGQAVGYCVVEIVRQPWKYVLWLGVWMMLLGCVLLFVQGAAGKRGALGTQAANASNAQVANATSTQTAADTPPSRTASATDAKPATIAKPQAGESELKGGAL